MGVKGCAAASGALAALVFISIPVSADDYEVGSRDTDVARGRIAVEIEVPESIAELIADASATTGVQWQWVSYPVVGQHHDEETGATHSCRRLVTERIDADIDREEFIRERVQDYHEAQENVYFPGIDENDAYADCPSDPFQELPEELIEHAVRRVAVAQLPRPELSIPPGYALAGLPAYLVTNHSLELGPVSRTLDLGTASPTVTFTAVGTSTVDWGDGTVTEHTVAGAPYPGGQVVHTYADRGPVTVQIVDRWTVTYDVGGRLSGVLFATLDPVTIEDFAVREYRAVRVSPDR